MNKPMRKFYEPFDVEVHQIGEFVSVMVPQKIEFSGMMVRSGNSCTTREVKRTGVLPIEIKLVSVLMNHIDDQAYISDEPVLITTENADQIMTELSEAIGYARWLEREIQKGVV